MKTYENFITDFFKKKPKDKDVDPIIKELNDAFYDTFLPFFSRRNGEIPIIKNKGNLIIQTQFDTSICLSLIEKHNNKIFIVFSEFFLPKLHSKDELTGLRFFYDKMKELTERTTEPDTTFLFSIEKTRELIDFLEMRDAMNKYNL